MTEAKNESPDLSPKASTLKSRWAELPESVRVGLIFATIYVTFYEMHTLTLVHAPSPVLAALQDLVAIFTYVIPIILIELLSRGALRRGLLALYLGLRVFLDAAFISSDGHIDFTFVRDNIAEAFSRSGASLLLAATPVELRIAIPLELVMVVALVRQNAQGPWALSRRGKLVAVLTALSVFVLATVDGLPSTDPVVGFARSIAPYYARNKRIAGALAGMGSRYPFIHTDAPSTLPEGVTRAAPGSRPNVIVLLIESFSGAFVGKVAPDGEPYTPTMNRLLDRGLSVKHFYGNSVQTPHGQFATFCSLAPSFHRKEAYIVPLALECLPNVLREEGYSTAFYAAEIAENFDGIHEFSKRAGFEEATTSTPGSLLEDERKHLWGWGLQDDVFYEHVFRALTARRDPSRPFFAALATISNHYPFSDEPGMKPIAGELSPTRGNYAASIRASDKRLTRFLELLDETRLAENTLVVITGDHAFPADEHGFHLNEQGMYEESFVVPLIILWRGHIQPTRLEQGAFSQLDIAPTVLDLLGITRSTPFLGKSLFVPGPRFVPLVQPYDGQYLGAIAWPWKYREYGRTNEVSVFNLQEDPKELHPLPLSAAPPEVGTKLSDDVDRIYVNQALLQSNRIWPKAAATAVGE